MRACLYGEAALQSLPANNNGWLSE